MTLIRMDNVLIVVDDLEVTSPTATVESSSY
jgi:hypothetical protein